MLLTRRRIGLAALLAFALGGWIAVSTKDKGDMRPMTLAAAEWPANAELKSLGGAVQWLNSPPLGAAELRGKVVLVDFWTLTCINWLHTLPYVRAWANAYRDHGLVVIGVHTPEFGFEKDIGDIGRAAKARSVTYPIAVDSNYAIWRGFDNEYWPALYLFDATGRVRHHQFGEGGYAESEKAIRQLLTESGHSGFGADPAVVEANGPEIAADWADLRSPETYVGYARTDNFGSPGGILQDVPNLYRSAKLPLNAWGLAGTWTVGPEFAALDEASGRIAFRFHARDLHLVMAPAVAGRPIRFRVTLDGAAPGANHGIDVDADGIGTVEDGRLYQLIRQTGAITDRSFEIEFLDPGIRAYDFTFG